VYDPRDFSVVVNRVNAVILTHSVGHRTVTQNRMTSHPPIVDVTVKLHLDELTYGTSFPKVKLSLFLGILLLALEV
jgi:hypothetical protein